MAISTAPQPIENPAKNILKAELARREISYPRLCELMAARGWNLSKASIDNKMSRGSFSADFFLEALRAIGCSNITISQIECSHPLKRNDDFEDK